MQSACFPGTRFQYFNLFLTFDGLVECSIYDPTLYFLSIFIWCWCWHDIDIFGLDPIRLFGVSALFAPSTFLSVLGSNIQPTLIANHVQTLNETLNLSAVTKGGSQCYYTTAGNSIKTAPNTQVPPLLFFNEFAQDDFHFKKWIYWIWRRPKKSLSRFRELVSLLEEALAWWRAQ